MIPGHVSDVARWVVAAAERVAPLPVILKPPEHSSVAERRRFSRQLREAEACIADASDENAHHYYALLSREFVVRKAMGEFE